MPDQTHAPGGCDADTERDCRLLNDCDGRSPLVAAYIAVRLQHQT